VEAIAAFTAAFTSAVWREATLVVAVSISATRLSRVEVLTAMSVSFPIWSLNTGFVRGRTNRWNVLRRMKSIIGGPFSISTYYKTKFPNVKPKFPEA
jgi:hypothetical protein